MRNAVGLLDIRYARSSGVSIAYLVVGEGETDLVCVPDFVSNLVYWWESKYWRPFFERLARSFRVILFDKRGTGLSDRGGSFPTLETRMEDVRAVMDAVYGFANELRVGASPAMGYELNRAFEETDLRDVYAVVRVPTLVLYRDTPLAVKESLAVAAEIPGARAMRVSGIDYWGMFTSFDIVDELERFLGGETAPAVPESVLTTLLFTDIVDSTAHASRLGDRSWRDLLAQHHAAVRRELARFRGDERDTAGDGFFATFDGPARAVRCAQAAMEAVRPLGLELRAGIHTGECEIHEGKVAGVALAIGARVCGEAGANEVLVSRTVKDLVAGSGLGFETRGTHTLKDVGDWELYAAGPDGI